MKIFRCLFCILFFLYICPVGPVYAQLTEDSLKNSLSYYHKTSKEKNLGSNDRLYILLKIKEKYKGTNVNLSSLEAEIARVKNPEPPPEKTVPVESPPQPERKEPKVEKPQEKYIISPSDVLVINVEPTKEVSKEVIVQPDGTISLSLIGEITTKGLSPEELARSIEKGLTKYVTNPKVVVTVKYSSERKVMVTGAVNRPGSYPYKEKLRLLELFSAAGGLSSSAGTNSIKIHRGSPENRQTLTVDFDQIMKKGDLSEDFILQPGDIVEVPSESKKISVIGSVQKTGSYDYKGNTRVLDIISNAGGPTSEANIGKIRIYREVNQKRKTYTVDLGKVMAGQTDLDIFVQPGDIIFVPRKSLVTGTWFIQSILPWLTLITFILTIRTSLG